MKKNVLLCSTLFVFFVFALGSVSTADAEKLLSREEAVRARFALKREKLAEVVAKKRVLIEDSILTRIQEQMRIKEERILAQQAAAEQAAAQASAENHVSGSASPEALTEAQNPVQEPPVAEVAPAAQPEAVSGASVTTGASQVVTGASYVVSGASLH